MHEGSDDLQVVLRLGRGNEPCFVRRRPLTPLYDGLELKSLPLDDGVYVENDV